MSIKTENRTSRQAYIGLLNDCSRCGSGLDLGLMYTSELIEAGYLSGETCPDARGFPLHAAVKGITVEGRLFLQKLKQEEWEASWRGKTVKYIPLVIAYLAGLLSPIFTDWLRSFAN